MMRGSRTSTGSRHETWPVLALLVLTVIVPTACVLWFMVQAMASERLAVRQRLTEAYRAQLAGARARLEADWIERTGAFITPDPQDSPPARFAALVRQGIVDSVVLYDPAGRPDYPAGSRASFDPAPGEPRGWSRAEELEYRRADPAAAARSYEQVAERAENLHHRGRALQARARCLAKAGETQAAIDALVEDATDESLRGALDRQGRLIQLDALLRALQLMRGSDLPALGRATALLVERLEDYSDGALSADQRRFLMNEIREVADPAPVFPTLAAEELAHAYLELHPTMAQGSLLSPFDIPVSWLAESAESTTPILRPSLLPRVWQLPFPDRRGLALFRQERLLSEIERECRRQGLPSEVVVTVLPPGSDPPAATFASMAVGRPLTGWRLSLRLEDGAVFGEGSSRQSVVYLWTGTLFVMAIVALTALVARYVGRQMRVARIKNDLVATVTHELKTPLSSIRMLVDTLLEGHYRNDEPKTREYLELISRENARLSRLIDHFLTFSRMERNKRAFDFSETDPARIAEEAIGAIRDRFEAAGFELTSDVADGLPMVVADADAMVTVLLNLLENAMKYSDGDRRVAVRVLARDGSVSFEVEDHGIGMSARTARKVFDRFYQADRSLARRVGGCGLGLSIVKFVVEAHAGSVAVRSRPGQGSAFTVTLPAAGSAAAERLLEEGR